MSNAPDIVTAAAAVGIAGLAALVGYVFGNLGTRSIAETNFEDKIVSELRKERDELFHQLMDHTQFDRNKQVVVKEQGNDKFVLYLADFCPFSQRVWIALLEKKVPFELVYVNFFNKSLPDTKQLLKVNPKGTIPAATHRGQNLAESMDMIYYIDETFAGPPLLPSEPVERFKARTLLRQHGPIAGKFFSVLRAQGADFEREAKSYLEALKAFEADIAEPFVLGNQFSIVDIALIPFIARTDLILGHFKKLRIPAEFAKLLGWVKNCTSRESYIATNAPRNEASMKTFPFHARERDKYLLEESEFYAANKVAEMTALLANATGPLPREQIESILHPKQ